MKCRNVWSTNRWLRVPDWMCCIRLVWACVVWRSKWLDTTDLQCIAAILLLLLCPRCHTWWTSKHLAQAGEQCGTSKCFLSSHESRSCFTRSLQLNTAFFVASSNLWNGCNMCAVSERKWWYKFTNPKSSCSLYAVVGCRNFLTACMLSGKGCMPWLSIRCP